jgi:hypothetical protein
MSENMVVGRNAGIAWEPGVFQFLINLGLYSHIKMNKKVNLYKLAIYSLAIITTKSTAGLLIFIFITFNLFLKDKKARVIIVASVLAFGGILLNEFIYQLKYKLMGSSSFSARLEPLLNAFNTGKSYFLGLGNNGYDEYYKKIQAPWDSLGQIFVRYGYPMFIFIIYRLLKLINSHFLLVIILGITLSSQNIWFFPMVTPFYFYGTNSIGILRGVKNENIVADKLTNT